MVKKAPWVRQAWLVRLVQPDRPALPVRPVHRARKGLRGLPAMTEKMAA